jgi:two-component system phosphate regulon response regulator PhoB
MERLLIIEDEADLRQVLEYNFRQAGFEAVTAASGQDGLRSFREQAPQLVLLDLMLPDISGLEVCRAMKRERDSVPVVMLTAKGEEVDRVVGFELGVDDYVVKPFSVRELILRVQAILRRRKSEPQSQDIFEFGELRIDRSAHRAWVTGKEVELTALEFKLLNILLERRDRVQSRSTLLDVVWGITADINTRTVDTHVKRLREKLGAAADYIETVRGIGYRFAAAPP